MTCGPFTAENRVCSLLQNVWTLSGVHQASCSVGTGGFSLGLNHLECEDDHSPPSRAPVKNEWVCTSVPLHAFMACLRLNKQAVTLNMLR